MATEVTAMAELCRWRLWERTGGGLMAELGSHQLDAAGIFISALRKDGKKVSSAVRACGRWTTPVPVASTGRGSCLLHV